MSLSDTKRDPAFEALLDYLKHNRDFDFRAYKRTSLMRRVRKRMQRMNINGFQEYKAYLEAQPEEFTYLFNTILINVTGFFRDQEAWECLGRDIMPQLMADKPEDEAIRVWSAGCASGEEAYSVAILLAEALGVEAFRRRVKIYATDVDEEALVDARQATYKPQALQTLSPDWLSKYFEPLNGGYIFRNDLRRCLIFGRNDLIQDAPISRLDLLICRNTFMYFNAEAQKGILTRFHLALNDKGYLFLGKAEMLLSHSELFTPAQMKYRIFTKAAKTNLHDRLMNEEGQSTNEGLQIMTDRIMALFC